MQHTFAVLVLVPVVALGCGGRDAPTTPTPRATTIEAGSESRISAHTTSCVGFRQGAAGEASASVTLASASVGQTVPIEMGAGSCAGPQSVVARGDRGAVSATLPAGESFVRFENTGDSDAGYRLMVRHLILY